MRGIPPRGTTDINIDRIGRPSHSPNPQRGRRRQKAHYSVGIMPESRKLGRNTGPQAQAPKRAPPQPRRATTQSPCC
eukprot:IDg22375t1